MTFKSGFVAIVGRPNVGKSTLLNHVIGEKVSIVSDKAQTTRNKIVGVYTTKTEQIVFIDTPGIHKPKTYLGDLMVEAAYSVFREVDLILWMISAGESRGKGDTMIIKRLRLTGTPVILVVNKIDKVHPDELFVQVDDFRRQMEFKEVMPISALRGDNVVRLMDILVDNLEKGYQYFPDTQITNCSERFFVSEMIREKVLQLTREEIPHSVAVIVECIKHDKDTKQLHIQAMVIVERESQKGILVGKRGNMIQKINSLARRDIEFIFGEKVFLEIWVKVKKNWRDKRYHLNNFGYQMK